MIVEKVTTEDFKKIAMENEFFLWSFLQKNQNKNSLVLYSYFDEKEGKPHQLKEFLEFTPINYYESYVEDSVDFLIDFGFSTNELFKLPSQGIIKKTPKEFYFNPYVLLFKKFELVDSTKNHCYCVEGLTKMLLSIPNFAEKFKLD